MAAIFSFILQAIPFYLGFNVLMGGVMLYKQYMTKTASDWPTTPGKILSSRLSYTSSTDKTDPTPFVTYSYVVDGKTYKGVTITPGWISESGQEYSESVVVRYPKGAEVAVYYNPKKPDDACLEKYSLSQSKDWAILIGGNLLMPIVVLIYRLFSGH